MKNGWEKRGSPFKRKDPCLESQCQPRRLRLLASGRNPPEKKKGKGLDSKREEVQEKERRGAHLLRFRTPSGTPAERLSRGKENPRSGKVSAREIATAINSKRTKSRPADHPSRGPEKRETDESR